jgi:serine/threonine protein kinase
MNAPTQSPRRCAGCLSLLSADGSCPACQWNDSAYPETHEHLARHTLLADRYYIGRALGQGGFGITYMAWDERLDRAMAIKECFPRDYAARLTDRTTVRAQSGERGEYFHYALRSFLDEARRLARFSTHPNIVPIADHIDANGTSYLVMTYLEGMTLKDYVASQGGRIPYADAYQILMPAMDALREVHSHGIVHRDVSPDNIFITRGKQVKLIDFGAARFALGEHSQNLSMILKEGFAPWEQYESKARQGPWTDVYAVAATMYRCVTGQMPPRAPDRILDDGLEPASKYVPEIAPEVGIALAKGLAVRATQRIQSVEEFQRSLPNPSVGAMRPEAVVPVRVPKRAAKEPWLTPGQRFLVAGIYVAVLAYLLVLMYGPGEPPDTQPLVVGVIFLMAAAGIATFLLFSLLEGWRDCYRQLRGRRSSARRL